MSKSAIYLANLANSELEDGDIIPIGTIVRRYGQNVRQDGNSVTVCDKPGCPGYYSVDVIAMLELGENAEYTVTLEKDGVAALGSFAVFNGAPASSIVPFQISVIIKNSCGGTSNLSVRVKGGKAKVINMTTTVERL